MRFQASNRPWWEQLSSSARAVPIDLLVVAGLLVAINAVFRVAALREVTVGGARVQALLGIPALLLVPGYLLVAAAFPGRRDNEVGARSVDLVERVALSFGMSVAIAPLFAAGVGTVWGFGLPVMLTGFTTLVAVLLIVAAVRRIELPARARFEFPIRRWIAELDDGIRHADSTGEGIATLFLAFAVLLAVGAVGFAVATPYTSGPSSTFYLATQNESGTVVASGYPTSVTAGEGVSLVAGIGNEGEVRQRYTVVVAVERVEEGGEELRIVESNELDRLHADVPAGAEWTGQHTVAPEMTGEDLRLHYYLYRGETAPDSPDPSTAYQDAYIWIDVHEA